MRCFVKIFSVVAALMLSLSASAQTFGGLLFDRDGMMASDMYELSQVGFGFGTARSMSMAGAFTSLGGDISSMGINPAGLGMYRTNDFSISPMLGFERSKNSAPSWGKNGRDRFSMSNVGFVFNITESGSEKGLISFNFGVGYNRIADFNYRYGYHSESAPSVAPYRSIVDAFSLQMGSGGVFPKEPNGALNYDFGDAYYWGGILAYKDYLLDAEQDAEGMYWTSANRIGANAGVGHTMNVESRGSIGEVDLSFGMNFSNKLYVGATLGLQIVNWKRGFYYSEDYLYGGGVAQYADGTPLEAAAEWMDYDQVVKLSGTGINFKAGIIYRPIPALRLGMAVHTPTTYSLDRKYQAFMGTNFSLPNNGNDGDLTPILSDKGENAWVMNSPTRLMFGASYTFGRMAVVSVDYERTWYNGMRMMEVPYGFEIYPSDYTRQVKDNYKGANTVRVGAEVKPLPMLALRLGYGLQASMLRHDKQEYFNRPQAYRTSVVSAGVGFSFGRATLDFAYQNISNKQTGYYLYWADDAYGDVNAESQRYSTTLRRHYAVMTFGYRF